MQKEIKHVFNAVSDTISDTLNIPSRLYKMEKSILISEEINALRESLQNTKHKPVLGIIEPITLIDVNGKKQKVLAKIDTGADSSSIDMSLAANLSLGPITKTKQVVSSHGKSLRPVLHINIELAQKQISGDFNLYNRAHMTYKILIGRNILSKGFLIDPALNTFKGFSQKEVTEFEKMLNNQKNKEKIESQDQTKSTSSKKENKSTAAHSQNKSPKKHTKTSITKSPKKGSVPKG
jgi:hypothetical protein